MAKPEGDIFLHQRFIFFKKICNYSPADCMGSVACCEIPESESEYVSRIPLTDMKGCPWLIGSIIPQIPVNDYSDIVP
jgi:hypothetical protein